MTDVVSRGKLDLGAVFAGAGRALGRRGWRMVGVVLGFYVAPSTVLALLMPQPYRLAGLNLAERVLTDGGALIYAMLAAFVGVAVTRISLDTLAGRDDDVGAQIAGSGRPWLTLLPLTLLLSASTLVQPFLTPHASLYYLSLIRLGAVGMALVGALFWGLATAVATAEGRGLIATLSRSHRLLGRGRWLFGLFYLGLLIVTQLVNSLLFYLVVTVGRASGLPRQGVELLPLFGVLPSAIGAPLWRAFTAAYYRELCRLRDGAPPGEVAAIFE